MAGTFVCRGLLFVAAIFLGFSPAMGQQPPDAVSPPPDAASSDGAPASTEDPASDESQPPSDDQAERERWFTEHMTGATLHGRFTILGRDAADLPEEQYTIVKCEKLDQPDLYRFTARIKYGEVDQQLPLDLPVHWAGDTPVISLTNMWIPGMGTFSTRVLIYRDSYAGTWSHDEVGGHMFGTITRKAEAEPPKE